MEMLKKQYIVMLCSFIAFTFFLPSKSIGGHHGEKTIVPIITSLLLLNDHPVNPVPLDKIPISLRTFVASVLSKGRFTINSTWSNEGNTLGINADYQGKPYISTVIEYEEAKRQCYKDYNFIKDSGKFDSPTGYEQYTFKDRKCYPKLELANELDPNPPIFDEAGRQILHRYGYYCGGGFGADHNEEPLDGVDYCCKLHDEGAWGGQGEIGRNECGIAMCLSVVTVFGTSSLPADVEEARQHWYGGGSDGGAALICRSESPDSGLPWDAPEPVPE